MSSRLDYCNSLYFGMSKQNIQKLQCVQNSRARTISQTSKYQRITLVLKIFTGSLSLNGLSIKFLFLLSKPSCMAFLFASIAYASDTVLINQIISNFCSLFIPRTRILTGKHVFSVAAPRIWNLLPACCSMHNNLCFFFSI